MRALFLATLLAAPFAFAQRGGDEGAIPYPEDEREEERDRRDLPRKSDATPNIREETDVEQLDREESLAGLDDPSIGISAEVVFGLLLLESSRGAGVEPRAMGGLRLTWEWTRTVFSDEFTREMSFFDVTYSGTNSTHDGTNEIFNDSYYHYLTLAPAFAIPFGKKSPVSFYGQLGIGLGINASTLTINTAANSISGTKFLVQYGIGLRGRPLLVEWEGGAMRLSFRVEVTRFRRGYMDDMFFGGSIGATF